MENKNLQFGDIIIHEDHLRLIGDIPLAQLIEYLEENGINPNNIVLSSTAYVTMKSTSTLGIGTCIEAGPLLDDTRSIDGD